MNSFAPNSIHGGRRRANPLFLIIGAVTLLLALIIGGAAIATYSKPTVTDVRVGLHPDKTRVVIESTAALSPQLFTLPSPPRIVIDIPESKIEPDLANLDLDERSGVKVVRAGLFKPGVTRIVLDVEEMMAVSKLKLPPRGGFQHRLVLDLAPTQAARIPEPATRPTVTPRVAAKPEVTEPTRPFVIVLDPGHGGVDPGAVTKNGLYEKNVVLEVSKRIARNLATHEHVVVYMTREDDRFIKLGDRVKVAQDKNADIFVSIHADAHTNRSVKGGSVYVLSEKSSDREAERLARIANNVDVVAGLHLKDEPPEVRDILIDLTQRDTMNQSVYLGQSVLNQMEQVAEVRKNEVLFAGFRVLKAPEIPSVLVELAYISNPNEARLLNSRSHQEKLATAVADGIMNYAVNRAEAAN